MASKVSIGTIPPEAYSKGGINEGLPAEQRKSEGPELSDRPKKGEFGEFLPSSYKISSGNTRTDR